MTGDSDKWSRLFFMINPDFLKYELILVITLCISISSPMKTSNTTKS